MPELTSRLRRRTLLTAASSEPDGCFTISRHGAGGIRPRVATVAAAIAGARPSAARRCLDLLLHDDRDRAGVRMRERAVPPSGTVMVSRV